MQVQSISSVKSLIRSHSFSAAAAFAIIVIASGRSMVVHKIGCSREAITLNPFARYSLESSVAKGSYGHIKSGLGFALILANREA